MTNEKYPSDLKNFVHLHCHSHYSFLDGGVRVQKLVHRAANLNMPALALSDHGNMCGAMDLYLTAKDLADSDHNWKVKPIIGTEAYITDDLKKRSDVRNHLLLLAADERGYKNLVKLNSISHRDGFYKKPRIDFDALAAHHEGLIVTSACLAGQLDQACVNGELDEAERIIGQYREVFGDRYYLEMQNHGIPDQHKANAVKLRLSRQLGVPFICTNDSHYLDRDDYEAHDCLLCISTGAMRRDVNRFKFENDQFYFKTAEEMWDTFDADLREGLLRTKEVADRCNVTLNFGEYFLPKFPDLPEGMTDSDYIRQLAEKGCEKRYGKLSDTIRDRLEFELGVINSMGFPSYFLITADFINWAKDRGIPVGPGRGSAAGSIVAYALGITDVDPLKYDLLFERFLNPSRISMPDIDIDFCPEGRDDVIQYVREKYGEDCVCQIITFAQLKAKAVVTDVGRVLEIPIDEVKRITKEIPDGPKVNLKSAFEDNPKLREIEGQSFLHRDLFNFARRLEGLNRHTGIHAAGVIIAPGPLENYVPLFRQRKEGSNGDAIITTQFSMEYCEKIGLLKMDFLGLRNLTIIQRCVELVKTSRGIEIDWAKIPDDDPPTYDMLQRGDAVGVFQLESDGMRKLLTRLKPNAFADLIALLAMYRPGPLESGMVDDYVNVKHGRQERSSLHPAIDDILAETNGVILYQEQVMRIAAKLGGFSLAESDNLRKAMGKKNEALMGKFRDKFVEGATTQGHDGKKAGEIFDLMAFFAGYGFNKCVVGETEIIDAHTGERTTVGDLFRHRRPFTIHALGDDWKLHARRVTDVMANGTKPVFEIRTAQGKHITATTNHPFRTLDGWTNLENLQIGDRLAMARRLPIAAEKSMPAHELVTLAGLISEGNTCHPSCLYFFNNDHEAIDDFVSAVENFPNTVARVDHRSNGRMEVCVSTGRSARFVAGHRPWNAHRAGPQSTAVLEAPSRSGAFEWASNLEIIGKKATEKFVPDVVFQLRDSDVALFLGRLWSGDGFIANATQAVPYYATSSLRLARDVQLLLLRLGIFAGIDEKAFAYREGTRKGFTVQLLGENSAKTFAESICPHIVGRRESVEQLLRYIASVAAKMTSKDTIPPAVKSWVDEERKTLGLTWRNLEAESGVSCRGFFDHRKSGFRRDTVNRLAKFFASRRLANLAASDVFWDRIVAIEPKGLQPTYDLTVEVDHNFVADGFVAHNSHSTAYAFVTFQTAYLKANYPVEYQAALMTCEMGTQDKLAQYLDDTRQIGVIVRGPDIRVGEAGFSVVPSSATSSANGKSNGGANANSQANANGSANGKAKANGSGNGHGQHENGPAHDREITYGLGGIKGVGVGVINAMVAERRENGEYQSLLDFAERLDPKAANTKVLEQLVRAGALDQLARITLHIGDDEDPAHFARRIRPRLLAGIETLRSIGAQKAAERRSGQMSLFGAVETAAVDEREQLEKLLPDSPAWSDQELLSSEKETLGFYFTSHPLARYAQVLEDFATHDTASVRTFEPGTRVLIGGVVTSFREVMTKKGEPMAIFEVEDMRGKISCVCFPKAWEENHDNLHGTADSPVVFVQGRTDQRQGEEDFQILADRIIKGDDVREELTKAVAIRLRAEQVNDGLIGELRRVIAANRGEIPVRISVISELGRVLINTGPRWRVRPSVHFHEALESLLGPLAVSFLARH